MATTIGWVATVVSARLGHSVAFGFVVVAFQFTAVAFETVGSFATRISVFVTVRLSVVIAFTRTGTITPRLSAALATARSVTVPSEIPSFVVAGISADVAFD